MYTHATGASHPGPISGVRVLEPAPSMAGPTCGMLVADMGGDVSGFGRARPWADKGGFDLIPQGFAVLMAITGERGGPPVKTGNSVADINAGLLAAVGMLAAFVDKLRTGAGQVVVTAVVEAAL